MNAIFRVYDRAVKFVSGKIPESIILLVVRVALAGIFWRSGRLKVEEGSILKISETTFFQFDDDPFNKLPLLSPEIAAHVTTYAEHIFPILLVIGLFTRPSALALAIMTLTIQFFIFTDAQTWWQTHIIWTALALMLILRGGGMLSLDHIFTRKRVGAQL